MRPTAMRVSRARVPLERSDANAVRDYTAYVVLVLVVVVHVVVVRSSAAQRASVGNLSRRLELLGSCLVVLSLFCFQRRRGRAAFVVRMRRDDDDDATTTGDDRHGFVASMNARCV